MSLQLDLEPIYDDSGDSWNNAGNREDFVETYYTASPMWGTFNFQHILMVIALAAVSVLLISILWNYCAKDEDEAETEPLTQQSKPIVVNEIRPGFIVVKGYPSHEETLRIAAEYDSIRGGSAQSPYTHFPAMPFSQLGAPASYTPTQYVQPPNSHQEGFAPPSGSLINLIDDEPRPPPYSPGEYQRYDDHPSNSSAPPPDGPYQRHHENPTQSTH